MNGNGFPKTKQNRARRQVEPFIQISSLVLNSDAYKDLGFSARSMLNEILNFHNGKNNGSIWMTKEVLKQRGFSKNTATRALKELISHGFIYMTRRGGNLNGGCSWYAITWLKINRVEGQHLENFVSNAYVKWQPSKKNDRSEFGTAQHLNLGLSRCIPISHDFAPYMNQAVRLKVLVALNPNNCDL
jgi:hypothetical protein